MLTGDAAFVLVVATITALLWVVVGFSTNKCPLPIQTGS